MTTTLKSDEECVAVLIESVNRQHHTRADGLWDYELTTEVHNVAIAVADTSKTLRINPTWLRFVVDGDDFKACVADEIVAWYLIDELTNGL